MRVAVIADTHHGIKSDSVYMLDYQEKFYKQIFLPYLIKNGITDIWHLGDLFDRRKYINFQTLSRTREMILDPLRDFNIQMHIIPGNHDVFHKNSNRVNSLKTLLESYNNINVLESAENRNFGSAKVMFVPWINPENESECLDFIKNNDADVVCGHFEIAGFQMYRGLVAEHGLESLLFNKFDKVFSGHFHLKSENNNIHYLGAPLEYTWADYNEDKGFHVFDTETKDLEFIKNPYRLYEKLPYNDEAADYTAIDYSQFQDKIIQVQVIKKTKPAVFENFIENLYKQNVIDLTILELNDIVNDDQVDINIQTQSTKTLIDSYINEIETDLDKDKLKSILSGLYVEAIHQE